MIYESILDTIGHTPLVRINTINPTDAIILAKVEYFNPSLSVKDRAAFQMIHDALERKEIAENTVLIEPTSGNTGIGLAMTAAVLNMKLIVVMPDSMSAERRKAIAGYGAELVLTPGALGMQGALDKADELHREIKDSFIPSQFSNPSNSKAHYLHTGPEIYEDTNGRVAAFAAGVGTGGTLSGTARYLKEMNPDIYIAAAEPASSAVINGKPAGAHKIQGIGANFIPDNLDRGIMDECIDITDEQALETARKLMTEEGIAAGISSGAAVAAAIQLGFRKEFAGKIIVALLPDSSSRYLSTELYD